MDEGRRAYRFNKASGWIAGCTVAALLMLVLAVGVSRLVVLWCPRGEDCSQVAQYMFWTGMAVSAAISISIGLVVRDLTVRWMARRPA